MRHLRIILLWIGIAAWVQTGIAQRNSSDQPPEFRFVAISDTQPMLEEQWGQMEMAIRESQEMVPDAAFYIFPGDLIHGEVRNDNPLTPLIESPNSEDDYKHWRGIVDRMIKIPWYAIPGNHEYSTELGACHNHPSGAEWDRPPVPEDSAAELERFRKYIGEPECSFVHEGVRFIGINTWENDARARLTDDQTGWIEQQLALPEKTKIVFGHHQIQGYRFGRVPLATHAPLMALLEKYKVPFYIHGHLHEMDKKEDTGTWHLSLPSTAWNGRLASKRGWMWFDVYADRIVGYYKQLGPEFEAIEYIVVPRP